MEHKFAQNTEVNFLSIGLVPSFLDTSKEVISQKLTPLHGCLPIL